MSQLLPNQTAIHRFIRLILGLLQNVMMFQYLEQFLMKFSLNKILQMITLCLDMKLLMEYYQISIFQKDQTIMNFVSLIHINYLKTKKMKKDTQNS